LEEVKASLWKIGSHHSKKPNGKALGSRDQEENQDLMHVLYAHAIRYEWIDHNHLGRSPGWTASNDSEPSWRRSAIPAHFRSIEAEERVMVLLDFGTGLRRGS